MRRGGRRWPEGIRANSVHGEEKSREEIINRGGRRSRDNVNPWGGLRSGATASPSGSRRRERNLLQITPATGAGSQTFSETIFVPGGRTMGLGGLRML